MYGYETYLSPLTWRYGSDEMRRIWSEENKHLLWRRIWVALAEAQAGLGLVSAEQAADLLSQGENIAVLAGLLVSAIYGLPPVGCLCPPAL